MAKSTMTTPTGSNRTGATTENRMTGRTGQELQPSQDIVDYLKDYARAKPEVAALWCLGIGFVVGWKLKPW